MKCSFVVVLLAALCACASPDKEIARDARLVSRNSVAGALQGLDDVDAAKLRAVRDKLVGDVDVRRLAEEVARAATVGAGEGLHEGDYARQVADIVDASLDVVRREGGGAVAQVVDQASPSLRTVLVQATQDFIRQASASLRSDAAPAVEQLVRTLADATTAAVAWTMRTLSKQMPAAVEQLTPALRALTVSVVAGGIQALREGVHAEDAHAFAFAIGNGLSEGVRTGLMDERSQTRIESALAAATVGLGLALIGSIAAAAALLRRWRLASASLVTIAERIEHSHQLDAPARAGLKRDIRTSADAGGLGQWLHGYLKQRGI